jgi:hypothetical protein
MTQPKWALRAALRALVAVGMAVVADRGPARGLAKAECVSLPAASTPENVTFLQTKRVRMRHLMDLSDKVVA